MLLGRDPPKGSGLPCAQIWRLGVHSRARAVALLTGTCSRRRASCWGQCPRELGPASPPPTPHAALGEGPQQCPSGRQRPPWPIQVGFCLRSLGRVTAGAGTGVLGGADPRGRLFLGAALPSMATASWEPLAARQGCVPSAPGVTPSALCQLHPGIYRDPGEHRGCLSQQGAPCTCAQREGWGLQADPGRPEEERGRAHSTSLSSCVGGGACHCRTSPGRWAL